ncbi:MAG TPA: hypothetical protein PKN95_07315 [Verrucomicrobiota bacterium]|nr:hypothetical protein [Verrucomicrobiota bacterium]HNT15038.1 hypothetical protein [Verrucomicrobiota bacterium]
MDLLKKHYEKIILGGVLLMLALGAAWLPLKIGSERDELRQEEDRIINQPAKPLEPLNFVTQQTRITDLRMATVLDLTSSNHVLNPMHWEKGADGRIVKIKTGEETGPKALVVTKQTPLYLKIALEGVNATETPPRYAISVEQEAALDRRKRGRKTVFATLNNKTDDFVIREVRGSADNPELVLELAEDGGTITLSKDKPYQRVDGYMVDLKYPLENRAPWVGQRVGSALKFGGEDYIIVAITKNEVVVSAKSNQKKTPIPIQL